MTQILVGYMPVFFFKPDLLPMDFLVSSLPETEVME